MLSELASIGWHASGVLSELAPIGWQLEVLVLNLTAIAAVCLRYLLLASGMMPIPISVIT